MLCLAAQILRDDGLSLARPSRIGSHGDVGTPINSTSPPRSLPSTAPRSIGSQTFVAKFARLALAQKHRTKELGGTSQCKSRTRNSAD